MIIYQGGHDPNLPTYSFTFPDGVTERLTFNPTEWRYYWHTPEGRVPLDGVTGVTKICTPANILMRWAVKVALIRTKQLLMDGGFVHTGESDSEFVVLYESVLDEILAKAKKEDETIMEDAGDVGTAAHDWIEKVIKTILVGNEERRHELFAKFPLDERASNCDIAACEWMVQHHVRWICTERKCFSRQYGYAGTMDGLAWVDSCDDPSCCPVPFKNRKSVIDWKSSNALRVSYLFQVAAYRHAFMEETGEGVQDTWILRLDKETGEFDPWHVEGEALFLDDFKGFLNCLETCRSIRRAEDRVSGVVEVRSAKRRAGEKVIRDAKYAIECPEAKNYKGSRVKAGCNGTKTVCLACQKIFLYKHA